MEILNLLAIDLKMFAGDSMTWILVCSMGLFVTFIFIITVISLIIYQKRYIIMQKGRIRAEIMMLEKERKHLASELHDSVGPYLSSIKLNISSMDTIIESDREIIRSACNQIDNISVNIRYIINNLMPSTLVRRNLVRALEEFISNIKVKDIKIEFECKNYSNIFSKEKELIIYRIVQEIINNCMKHSGASLMKILFDYGRDNLKIVIYDNGIGFDLNNNTKEGHWGLKNIESRIEMLKGSINFINKKESAQTGFIIKIPAV